MTEVDTSIHAVPAFAAGGAAVITGAASGIGLAAAKRFAAMGLKVVVSDRPGAALDQAVAQVSAQAAGGAADVRGIAADVSCYDHMVRLCGQTHEAFGGVSVLMNNAGVGTNPGKPWENLQGWSDLLDVNFMGAVHGVQAFVPAMLARKTPGLIINTGSKQGITLPPGNSAYNVSKAALKAYTELLAYELRSLPDCQVSAHLLIPGFTYTGMTVSASRPPAAWTPEQVVERLLQGLSKGDFYLLCADHDVTRAMDEARVQWTADDLIKNRPPLSRWHPDYQDDFARFMAERG